MAHLVLAKGKVQHGWPGEVALIIKAAPVACERPSCLWSEGNTVRVIVRSLKERAAESSVNFRSGSNVLPRQGKMKWLTLVEAFNSVLPDWHLPIDELQLQCQRQEYCRLAAANVAKVQHAVKGTLNCRCRRAVVSLHQQPHPSISNAWSMQLHHFSSALGEDQASKPQSSRAR